MCGDYKSFAEYFTSRGYIVFGNDIISHGRSNTSKSLGLYFNDWRNVYDDAEKTRAYVQEKYPYLPVYILGFSLGSYVVRTMGSLLPYKKGNPDWNGRPAGDADEIYAEKNQ